MTRLRPPASLAEELAILPAEELEEILGALSPEGALKALYDWPMWARPSQLRPRNPLTGLDDWYVWLNLSGRGSGKTRTGAETIRQWVEEATEPLRIALVGQTAADVRDVMLLGESGLLNISPPWNIPTYKGSSRSIQWPHGGHTATLFFGDSPDQLRGPQHHKAWVDELAKFRYPQETWDNLEFGLRLGRHPQALVTTTPRPIPIIKSMLEDPQVHVTRGNSYENISNLASSFIKRVIRKYEGTRVGRQELHADVLLDMPGALWTYDMLEAVRVTQVPEMKRIVVAVDPAVTAHEESDETGIVVCGLGVDGLGYVLRDVTDRYTANAWAQKVKEMYEEYRADRVVAEVNNGGDLVEVNVRTVDPKISYAAVHASRGKIARAEPVSSLYERRLIRHHGQFAQMEDEMTTFRPDDVPNSADRRRNKQFSPNRLDAMVWGMTFLLLPDNIPQSRDPKKWHAVKR